jgi:protein TonB
MNLTMGRTSWLAIGLMTLVAGATPSFADETPARVDTSANNAQPAYPDSAQANGEEGIVVLGVNVNSQGHVKRFRIQQSSGFADLDNAAVEAVMNWNFIPATSDGDNVTRWTTVQIEFKLPRAAQNQPKQ